MSNSYQLTERAHLSILNNRSYRVAETVGAALTVQRMLEDDMMSREEGGAPRFSDGEMHAMLMMIGAALAAALDYTVEVNEAASDVGLKAE